MNTTFTAALHIDYAPTSALGMLLADRCVLAVFGFGADAPHADDPRYVRVPLEPYGEAPLEVWSSNTPADVGRNNEIAWASNGQLQFGAIELEEESQQIEICAERLYTRLTHFVAGSSTPHLLRIWNYLDAITMGTGDHERYRKFNIGRARGLGGLETTQLPAATAIGHSSERRILQVYWLASAMPGTPLENPRQVSAYCYPRSYGPQSPSFARAMLPPRNSAIPLLLSGTASIVGHRSMHPGEPLAQLEEIFKNFNTLLSQAHAQCPEIPAHFDLKTRLKVYVREHMDLPRIAAALQAHLDTIPHVLLHGTICRNDLLVEIEGYAG
ncbi:MAG TPA: chorismate transformation enzyme, FkbO/Hyg5 family [Xylella taiwanensis]